MKKKIRDVTREEFLRWANDRATEDNFVIGVDFSNKNDIDTMVVGRIRNDQSIDIVNAFQGDEARELYEKLITNKSSLTMKE